MGAAAEDGKSGENKPREGKEEKVEEREVKDEAVVVVVDSLSRLQVAQPVGSLQVVPQARSIVHSSENIHPMPVLVSLSCSLFYLSIS